MVSVLVPDFLESTVYKCSNQVDSRNKTGRAQERVSASGRQTLQFSPDIAGALFFPPSCSHQRGSVGGDTSTIALF